MDQRYFRAIDHHAHHKTVGGLSKGAILRRKERACWCKLLVDGLCIIRGFISYIFYMFSLPHLNCIDHDPTIFFNSSSPNSHLPLGQQISRTAGGWLVLARVNTPHRQTGSEHRSSLPSCFLVCAWGFLGMFLGRGRQGQTQSRKRGGQEWAESFKGPSRSSPKQCGDQQQRLQRDLQPRKGSS